MIKKINKKHIKILSLVLLLILGLVATYYIDLRKFNSKLVDYDETYLMKITYLVGDRDRLDKDVTIEETVYMEDPTVTLYTATQIVPLTKDGDYLYADLGKFTHKKLLEQVTDAIYAKNTLEGEVIDGCEYDKETRILKVPYSYFENLSKDDPIPIQAEIESLLTRKEIRNLKTDYSVKKLITYNGTASNSLLQLDTKISLVNYVNGNLSKDNIHVYLNNSKTEAEPDSFSYDSVSKTLTLNTPSILINRVDIKFGNNIFKNVFAIASTEIPNENSYKLNSRPDDFIAMGSNNEYYTAEVSWYEGASSGDFIYCHGGNPGYFCDAGSQGGEADYSNFSNQYSKAYHWNSGAQTYVNAVDTLPQGDLYPYLVRTGYLATASGGQVYMDFENPNDYVLLRCSHVAEGVNTPSDDMGVQLQVYIADDGLHPEDHYLVLGIKTYSPHNSTKWNGWGGQRGSSWIRVYWEENVKCKMHAYKRINAFSNSPGVTADSTIGMYSDGACTNEIDSKTATVELNDGAWSNEVWFENLTPGTTYWFKEKSFTSGGVDLLSGSYSYTSGCTGITMSAGDDPSICAPTFFADNSQRSYCYSIKKVDAENNNTVVNGTTWTLTGASGDVHTATASNGIATFTNLTYQNYTLKETTASPADLDGNGTLDYWNDNSGNVSVPASSLTEGSTCNSPTLKADTKVYYCIKVIKKDYNTGNALPGAKFSATKGGTTISESSSSSNYATANGITSFFVGDSSGAGNWTITETQAPNGYTIDSPSSKTVAAVALKEYANESAARTACLSDSAVASNGSTVAAVTYNSNSGNNNYTFKDKKLLINWYKVKENGTTAIDGAEFKVKNKNGQYITVSAPESISDANNVTKACYKYTGTNSSGTPMVAGTTASGINMTGQVCVSGLPKEYEPYTVEETKATEYHTFNSTHTVSLTVNNVFASMTNSNKLVNVPTEFKLTKAVTEANGTQEGNTKYTVTINGVTKTVSLSEMTTEQLMKIGFTIYDSSGNPVPVKKVSDGNYEYGSNTIDQGGSGSNVTVLHLDANRQLSVKHLKKGQYSIKEVDTSNCQLGNGGFGTVANPTNRPSSAPSCTGGGSHSGECIGYYSPDYSNNTYRFTIDDCSSTTAASNSTKCGNNGGMETQSLTNIPTEVILTKKDLYTYQDAADVVDKDREKDSKESQAEFENDKERSDFDRIDFKVKDSSGNYLNFIYVGNSGTCGSDSDYSIYRYVPGLSIGGVDPNVFNYHANNEGLTITQTLHACGGHIKLINLCRGETYTFEEVKVPDDSVYVLEKQGTLNPEVCFEVPCSTNEQEHMHSKTAVINDKPTRVTFEKKDAKYNYLIPDETTTFEVYRCPKDSLCNPSDYSTVAEREAAGMKLIKFEPRSYITNDEEDPGLEVYRMMSDSDAENKSLCTGTQTSNCYITSVHPDAGRLVLRYLQSGYNYVLLETVAPKNYILPTGREAETPFTVVNTTVDVEQVNVPNSPTAVIIRKYADIEGDGEADSGKLLGGAKFRVYKVTNYNANKKVQDQDMEMISLKTIKEGIYENRPVLDTNIITTCTGDNCSYTPGSLGYQDTPWENIDDLIEQSGSNITSVLKEGTALIQYLEYDTYYVIEEVEAPVGYSLPENDDNRFTLVHINKNETEIIDTRDALINKPTSFTFYKFDEYNTPLDGATFYLQKLDNDKKYNTLNVSKETLEDGTIVYRADETSEEKEITTTGGSATVYYLEPGQYRILEVKAAEGYELPKKTINVATFFVDNDGLVYGSNIITNKKPQETIEYLASDKAELIINIQTGKVVIKYGLIITVLIGAIVGLIIFLKKRK